MSRARATPAPAGNTPAKLHVHHPVVEAMREGNRPEHNGNGFFLVLKLRSGVSVRGPVYGFPHEVAAAGQVKINVHGEAPEGAEPTTTDQTFPLDDVAAAEIEW